MTIYLKQIFIGFFTLITLAVPTYAQEGGAGKDAGKKPDLPLEGETEKLAFTTDEGTWISLDVSPDGETIIFELLGDLYRVSISGGEALRITEGLGYDAQPRISPDGQWLAFISDRDGNNNLWISKIDGSDPRKLSSEQQRQLVSPVWTPDGQYVVATRTGNPAEFQMFHRDGGSGLTLPVTGDEGGNGGNGGNGGLPGLGGVFSPDGRYLYFTERPRGGPGPQFPSAQISRYDMESGEVDPVTRGEGGGLRPALSPDGRLLVYATRFETKTGLRLRDLESGADRVLIWPVQRDSQERGGIPSRDLLPGYAFTPDGSHLIISFDGKIQRVSLADGSATPIPFRANVDLDIGPDLTSPYRVPQEDVTATIIHSPSLSADGERLAASVLTRLYVMDAEDGAASERLTTGDAWEFNPVFSPDGRWIAYVTWSMNEGGHIWRTRANGRGNPERLTEHPAFYSDLAFSPDGERIVAVRGNEFQRHQLFSEFFGFNIPLDLVWLPSDGGALSLIAPARGARTPHFAGDPERIYFYDGETLASVRYDGTDRREHLKVEGPKGNSGSRDPAFAEDVRISPDGRHALALVNKQLWLMPVTLAGGKPVSVNVRSASVPTVKLTDIGADFFGWADGGETVTWAIGSTFYQRPVSSIALREETEEEAEESKGSEEKEEEETRPPLDENENVTAITMTVTVPRKTPEGTLVLRGGAVITMAGDSTEAMENILNDADIVITDNRIAAIGARGSVEIPDGARILDMSGKFITPGFIDTHAHFEFRNQDVLEPQNWSLVANLAYGVTAGLDVQTGTKDYLTYRDLVETGQSLGLRAFMTGPGVFGPNDFQSYEETLAYLRRYSDHYNTKNIKSYLVGNRKQRQWVVKAAKELGLMPTTEGGSDMKLNITHAIDGMHGNEHTLPDGPLYKDVIELYAKTRTAYTPTLLVQYNGVQAEEYFFSRTEVHDDAKLARFYPHNRLDELTRRRGSWVRDDEFSFDERAADAARLQRAGGLVGVGGHGELQGLGYHWEMWSLAMGGMKPAEVLRAATIDGARIIGIDQDLGSLEAGKLADLVIMDANPLQNIRNTNSIHQVMKNGELYDGDTLNQVWPVEKELAPFWWWEE